MAKIASIFRTAAVLAVFFGAAGAPALAGSAKVQVRLVNAGLGFGFSAGDGVLSYRGHDYPFLIGGGSLGAFGASSGSLTGEARHIRKPADIAGPYAAIGGGVALAGGLRVLCLRNANGVVLELRGEQTGFGTEFGVSGFTLFPQERALFPQPAALDAHLPARPALPSAALLAGRLPGLPGHLCH